MISKYLQQILSARYGKDVRQSIHDSIKELNEVAVTAQGSATVNAQTAITKANEALVASQEAIESANKAKAYSDNAQAVAGVTVATQEKAGLVKGGENHIGLDGTLELVVKTTEASMPNSRKGRVEVEEIGGVSKQDAVPTPDVLQEVKKSVVSGVKTHGKNFAKRILPYVTTQWGVALYVDCDLQPSTQYTISFNGASGNTYYFNEVLFDATAYVAVSDKRVTSTFTTKSELPKTASTYSESAGWVFFKNSIAQPNDNVFADLQLELGTVATDYQPYKESSITLSQPIDLYGIGDVQDVITPKQIKRILTKKRVTSAMDIFRNAGWGEGSFSAQNFFSDGLNITGYATKTNMLCTHAKIGVPADVSSGATANAIAHGGGAGLYINFKNCSTVDELKTFIDENEVYVYYRLATETTEDLPLADQIALNSLATFDGATYIEFVSEVQPTFAGKYGASLVGGAALEGLLIARNNELRITALEA